MAKQRECIMGYGGAAFLPPLSPATPEMQKGDAELAPPGWVIPQSFEPWHMARHSRTVGPMRSAHIASAQCGSLSIGENGLLNRVAHMLGDDILRADEAMNTWCVVMIILFG